jgi:hypothetical protein
VRGYGIPLNSTCLCKRTLHPGGTGLGRQYVHTRIRFGADVQANALLRCPTSDLVQPQQTQPRTNFRWLSLPFSTFLTFFNRVLFLPCGFIWLLHWSPWGKTAKKNPKMKKEGIGRIGIHYTTQSAGPQKRNTVTAFRPLIGRGCRALPPSDTLCLPYATGSAEKRLPRAVPPLVLTGFPANLHAVPLSRQFFQVRHCVLEPRNAVVFTVMYTYTYRFRVCTVINSINS